MVTGWYELVTRRGPARAKREFVSVDARLDDLKKDTRSYEMLSRDTGKTMDDIVTPSAVSPVYPIGKTPIVPSGRRTPDYFGQTARYHTPARSFSSPRPPQNVTWNAQDAYISRSPPPPTERYAGSPPNGQYEDMNPLGMNRI